MNLSGFERWYPLNNIAAKDVPKQGKFVYIFRRCSTGEVIYIGSTTDLRRRLFGNYIGGVGGGTTKRIHSLLFKDGAIADIEVAWKESSNCSSEEKHLREAYLKRQGELPPWNKQF